MATINFGREGGTFYSKRHAANVIAAELGAGETDGWEYEVVRTGGYYKVRITDEDGEFVAFHIGDRP
jgi:hypothetical protein